MYIYIKSVKWGDFNAISFRFLKIIEKQRKSIHQLVNKMKKWSFEVICYDTTDGVSERKVPTVVIIARYNPGLYRVPIPDRRSGAAYSATELRRRKLHQLIARSLLLLMGIPSLSICSTMHYKFVSDNHLAWSGVVIFLAAKQNRFWLNRGV